MKLPFGSIFLSHLEKEKGNKPTSAYLSTSIFLPPCPVDMHLLALHWPKEKFFESDE